MILCIHLVHSTQLTIYKSCHRQFNAMLGICSTHFTQLAAMATIKTQAVLSCYVGLVNVATYPCTIKNSSVQTVPCTSANTKTIIMIFSIVAVRSKFRVIRTRRCCIPCIVCTLARNYICSPTKIFLLNLLVRLFFYAAIISRQPSQPVVYFRCIICYCTGLKSNNNNRGDHCIQQNHVHDDSYKHCQYLYSVAQIHKLLCKIMYTAS